MKMNTLLATEKLRYAAWKQTTPHLSAPARADGAYNQHEYHFCLPRTHADENLYAGIRAEAIAYFAAAGIPWHHGQYDFPSNHLCSSQVCCVNFLFPFIHQPDALADLLRPIYPTLSRILPIDGNDFVSFEYIGAENYLGERTSKHGKRTRGANCTSADAAVRFQHEDGRIQIALIEWKYTEFYSVENRAIAKSGTDRRAIYRHLWDRDDFPLDKRLLSSFDALFYEPFYQLFRQQCLAHEMERAGELDADIVSTLHIAPALNREFLRVTSPELRSLGDNSLEVWKRLVRQPDRFRSVTTEGLFGAFPVESHSAVQPWWEYTIERYSWMSIPS